MKIIRYTESDNTLSGILSGEWIIEVDRYNAANKKPVYGNKNLTVDDLTEIQKTFSLIKEEKEFLKKETDVVINSCVANPQKIICIGLNYRKHAIESGMAIPSIPVVFSKYNNTLCNYGEDIPLIAAGKEYDYEVELGVVIGKKAKNISAANALDYVLGYCTANDLSCRDLQFRSSQWLMGKSLDKFTPLGKCIVTKDEIPNPQNLQLTCNVNGELRQNSNTADMVFSVAEIIEDLTKHFTLEPGDLILTGTPEGVVFGMKEKKWLKPGDTVRVEIEKIGFTENKMI